MNESKWYESSAGHGLSWTIGGFTLAGTVPVITNVLSFAGLDIPESEVAQILGLGATITGSALFLVGALRKIWFRLRPS